MEIRQVKLETLEEAMEKGGFNIAIICEGKTEKRITETLNDKLKILHWPKHRTMLLNAEGRDNVKERVADLIKVLLSLKRRKISTIVIIIDANGQDEEVVFRGIIDSIKSRSPSIAVSEEGKICRGLWKASLSMEGRGGPFELELLIAISRRNIEDHANILKKSLKMKDKKIEEVKVEDLVKEANEDILRRAFHHIIGALELASGKAQISCPQQ